VAVVQYTYTHK